MQASDWEYLRQGYRLLAKCCLTCFVLYCLVLKFIEIVTLVYRTVRSILEEIIGP